jgi:hypothetical protein
MKSLTKICVAILTVLTLAAFSASAQTNSTTTNSPPRARMGSTRYAGTVASVDATAKTFTITNRNGTKVYHVTSKTKITKDGTPATFADITEGTKVRGSFHKDDSGDLNATTVLMGEVKRATPPASAAPGTNN